ncbi:hypothetical protein [Bradyrhizobium sp. LHD-71]|uniref:hypothetical protein n=1 Tax=Bradyrhizobium sp. LHD-71 TaxID=3072141 RepID=UPI00280E6BEF|nr:hypothetical protein [Bradyrhizobium sp. LHD-71]MDQ8727442.1 hypothetical protein [Bradyrhizobium sp. LHD-71]
MVDGISGLSSTNTISLPPIDVTPFELPEIVVTPDDPLPGDGSFGDPIAGFQATNAQISAAVNGLSQQIDATAEQMRSQSEATLAQVASTGASLSAQIAAANAPAPIALPTPEIIVPPAEPAAPPAPSVPSAASTVTQSDQITSPIDERGEQVADTPLADAVKTAAAGAVGYRAGMYGEVGVGRFTANVANEQRFGRFTQGSTLARPRFTGNGIDSFARRDSLAQRTLISSQATYDYARQQAAALGIESRDVRFETQRRALSPDRTYDVQIGRGSAPVTEVKAGRSINPGQVTKDIAAARNGLRIDYRFAGNPLTGNHGPNPAAASRLNAAAAATNNNLTHATTDVAPSRAGIRTVETTAEISRAARALGRVAAPIGVAADAFAIGSGVRADGGRFGQNATVAAAGAAGGWAGAAAGGWGGVQAGTLVGGAIGGPVGAPIGAVVGGLIGAIGGGLLGGWGGERAARAATN